ncbi:MAG: hypothetical protein PUB45_02245, partial [Bacteroidales bacterium]|nr:hypothetical protein [Bacteroidales bacterium]
TAELLAFAAQNDIKNPAKYIDKVKDALRDFRALATSNGVAPLFIDIIESRLCELSPDIFAPAVATEAVLRAMKKTLSRVEQKEILERHFK